MPLKRIYLYGFKCFGEVALEPVHPNLTVIVGEPGSGKTSIFHGLEYLLSDSFKHLQHIKESSENVVVEVALDKSKLQICFQGNDENEVVLSRHVDATSDRYYVNNNRETQYDVQCVLMVAGLSSSMQYNILNPGKINELLMASASQRLRLMLNITGMDKIEKQIQLNKNDLKEIQAKLQKVTAARTVASYKEEALEQDRDNLSVYELLKETKQTLEVLLNKNKSDHFKRNLELVEAADEEEEAFVNQELMEMNKEKLLVLYHKYADMRYEQMRRTLALEKRNTLQHELQIPPELELEGDYIDPMLALKEKGEEIQRRLAELEKEPDETEPDEAEPDEPEPDEIELMLAELEKEPDEVELMRLRNQRTIRKSLEEREGQISEVENQLQRAEVRYQSAVDEVKENLTLLIKIKREHEPKERELRVRAAELRERSSLLGLEIKKLCNKLPDAAAKSGENASRGLVIDAVQCDDSLNVAVQATAGERLFYHVAADDDARRELLSHNESGGEVGVVAMPHVLPEELDTPENPDITPLIEKLQFAEEDYVLMSSVFGKTVVCRNMDMAVMMSLDACDTVTLEGNMVLESGIMLSASGSPAQPAMKIYKDLKTFKSELKAVEKEAKDVKKKLDDLKLETQKCCSLENDIAKMRSRSTDLKWEVKTLTEQLACLKTWRDTIIREYLDEDTKEAMRREHLDDDTTEARRREHFDEDTKEARRNEKKKLIRSSCKIIKQRLILTKDPIRRQRLVNQKTLEKLRKFKESIEPEPQTEARALEVGINEKLSDAKEAITEALAQEKAAEENVRIRGAYEQRMQNKKKCVVEKMMLTKNIKESEAASLPEGEQNENMTPIQAMEALIEVNVALHQQSIGMERPIDYEKELEEVQMFDEEIREQKKIAIQLSELIKKLESKQFNCFTRILQQISAKFTEFFTVMVPQGHAILKMLNMEGQAIPPEDMFQMGDAKGIRIEASLNIDTTPVQDVRQLSRQEREPVAVALKLAFIRFTEAPFFLFDGLDRMLKSPLCRQVLGDIITAFSMRRQSIVIAYTPEVVRHGNQFFMVRQENQVSRIVPITKEEALQFVSPHTR